MPRSKNKNLIFTKWVFKKKLNEEGQVIISKAILVSKAYAQIEVIDFDETFSLVARLEALRMSLALAGYKGFKVYQMDVKSAFLNGKLEEEVYIEWSEGFWLSGEKDYVCKLKKAIYGIKQAPRARYVKLDKYLHQQGFQRGIKDKNLYIKLDHDNMIVIVSYVDDIIFGSNNDN